MYRYFQGELEKACDERVLARLGADRKKDYSQSLLSLAGKRQPGLLTPLAFGEDDTKDRVKRILSYRRPIAAVTALVSILAIVVCATLFTTPVMNPQAKEQPESASVGSDTLSNPSDPSESGSGIRRGQDRNDAAPQAGSGQAAAGQDASMSPDEGTAVYKTLENGTLTEIPQEIYDFLEGNFVELYETLPLHTDIGSAETFSIEPQNVRFLKVSADWEWILLETEDGRQGWVHIVDFEVAELHLNVMDVFAGRYLAG